MGKEKFILNVYLVDSCFEFCIKKEIQSDEEFKCVKFENIIGVLKNDIKLADLKNCPFKNPSYIFEIKIIKNDGNGESGFTIELALIMANNYKSINLFPINNTIKIKELKNKNSFIINGEQKATCISIIELLLLLVGEILQEYKNSNTEELKDESPKSSTGQTLEM